MDVFKILIEKEAEYDRIIKEAQTKREISIKWIERNSGKTNGIFSLPKEDNVKIGEGKLRQIVN